jgi:hypothetical protein
MPASRSARHLDRGVMRERREQLVELDEVRGVLALAVLLAAGEALGRRDELDAAIDVHGDTRCGGARDQHDDE